MLKTVQDYKNGSIRLTDLINTLDALRNSLQSPSESWTREFEHEWGTLEDVLAVMADRGDTQLDDIGQKLVEEALAKLESLMEAEIARSPN